MEWFDEIIFIFEKGEENIQIWRVEKHEMNLHSIELRK